MNVRDKVYFNGPKPIYWKDCAAHANVYRAVSVRNGGVYLTGPICDASHKVEKLMSKWVPLDEFNEHWKELHDD